MFLPYFHKKNISTNKYTNAFAPLSVWDCTIRRIAGRTVEAILVDSVLNGLGEIGLQLDRCDRKAV